MDPSVEELSRRARYDLLRGRARKLLWLGLQEGLPWPAACVDPPARSATSFKAFRSCFDRSPKEFKDAAMQFYSDVMRLTDSHRDLFASRACRRGRTNKTVLLTYMQSDDTRWHSVDLSGDASLSGVCAALQADEVFQRTTDNFKAFVLQLRGTLAADHYACCAEVCPTTWAQQGVIRVRFHCFFIRLERGLRQLPPACFLFGGACRPHYAATPLPGSHGRGKTTQWRGWDLAGRRPAAMGAVPRPQPVDHPVARGGQGDALFGQEAHLAHRAGCLEASRRHQMLRRRSAGEVSSRVSFPCTDGVAAPAAAFPRDSPSFGVGAAFRHLARSLQVSRPHRAFPNRQNILRAEPVARG